MSTTCNRCRNFSNMERSHMKMKLLNNIYMQEFFFKAVLQAMGVSVHS